MEFKKFVPDYPSNENAIDIFSGHWVSSPEGAGAADRLRAVFESDIRPALACQAFGLNGRLEDMDILELGPLEGGHTFMLERAGAKVTAIEGNAEAYMKCLIVKETLGLQSHFLLGSFLPWLEEKHRYDLIFASGVLYHMPDPARLIRLISQNTDRLFLWTHYYDANDPVSRTGESFSADGLNLTYYRIENLGRSENPRWWGGLYDSACWLSRDDLLSTIKHYGFRNVEVLYEGPASEGISAHITLACSK